MQANFFFFLAFFNLILLVIYSAVLQTYKVHVLAGYSRIPSENWSQVWWCKKGLGCYLWWVCKCLISGIVLLVQNPKNITSSFPKTLDSIKLLFNINFYVLHSNIPTIGRILNKPWILIFSDSQKEVNLYNNLVKILNKLTKNNQNWTLVAIN